MKIVRDLSWLSFNERVLQEAGDPANHPYDRLRFLGIFSNNQDEFFRVRVAALRRMTLLGEKAKMHLEERPENILNAIQRIVLAQQRAFGRTYRQILTELARHQVFIRNEKRLRKEQSIFIAKYFEENIRTRIIPLMIEGLPTFPLLQDKSLYLACVLSRKDAPLKKRFAIIEIPARDTSRFVILPSAGQRKELILLEDIIRYNLPKIFSAFDFDIFKGYVIKITRDAELDLDNDIQENIIEAITKGIKNRKKGKATRFDFERRIDPELLSYLIRRMQLSKKDHFLPGGRIHNHKDFLYFPPSVFTDWLPRAHSFVHPDLRQPCQIMKVLNRKDILLHLPYHSFDSVIDLLREAAMDPLVDSIKLTCYRLSKDSKVVNALVNAVRNGKQVTVVLELRARFDEEANMAWKTLLEDEGVRVVVTPPGQKRHLKLCLICKRISGKSKEYGFFSTGNFNENTAIYYGDHCLMTANTRIVGDIRRIFAYLEDPQRFPGGVQECHTLSLAPWNMRSYFMKCIDSEILAAKRGKHAEMKIKLNSLSDSRMIDKLYEAANAGVKVRLIVRGICCAVTDDSSFKVSIQAVSIIDEYLEHARVFVFHNQGKTKVYISSADWMVRNLDHRVEAACPVWDERLKRELIDMVDIQLSENVKARVLDNGQTNQYVSRPQDALRIRSQLAIHEYLRERHRDHEGPQAPFS